MKKLLKNKTHSLILFSFIVGMLFISNNVLAQKKSISLSLKDMPIVQILDTIEKHSGYIYIYESDLFMNLPKKSIVVKNQTIEAILDNLFKGLNVAYTVNGQQISLYKKAQESTEKKSQSTTEKQKKKVISGKVTDNQKYPLPGVNIVVKGTKIATISNIDGRYTLEIPTDAETLVFSFVGMKTHEINLGESQEKIDVILEDEYYKLDELVVVGYGAQKKESVIGAISQVDSEALMRSSTSNITTAMAGKVSGLLTIQHSGEPGDNDSEIIIRGISSWNGSSPLIMVDGVERDFSDLDPGEIHSISVLKDASATAVFGARGANGVVLVTTKRGLKSAPKLNITYMEGIIKPTRVPDFIDSYTTMSMYNTALMNEQNFNDLISQQELNEYKNPSSPLMGLRYPNVDWWDLLTNEFASSRNATISVQGGGDFAKYFCSIAYSHEGDFFKAYDDGAYVNTNYSYDRLNYRSNIDLSLSKTTKFSFNLGGSMDIKNTPQSTIWAALYTTSPARYPAFYPSWVLEQVPDLDYPDASGIRRVQNQSEYFGNPYTIAYDGSFYKYFGSKLFVDIVLDQQLDLITKGLSVKGKVSQSSYYRNLISQARYNFPSYTLDFNKIDSGENPWIQAAGGNEVYTQPPLNITGGGLQSNFYSDLYYEIGLNYNRTFANHTVTGLALLNRQEKQLGTSFPFYNEGLVGRLTYDYGHKYLVEVNVGYTGSERFAPKNRFGFFPSIALGWWVSEEPFFKNEVSWINKLKIRYSDGFVGSDYAASRWLYVSNFFMDNVGYIHEDKGANTEAQWEMAHKRDIGVEISFLQNDLTFSIDFFDEYRDKMLLTPFTTMFVGVEFKDLNLGEMKKHGFEIEGEYKGKVSKNIDYFIKGNFGFNENRIIYKNDAPYTPEYRKAAGKPVDAQLQGVELTDSGYFTSVDDIHNNPAPIDISSLIVGDYKFLDYNTDGTISISDNYPVKGSMYPPIVYSFSSGITYKNLTFNFMFQGNAGKYVEYNQTMENEFDMGSWRVHSSQLDYWTPTNPDANHANLHYSFASTPNLSWGTGSAYRGYDNMIVGRFWRKADYLRLKDVYLGYTIKPEILKQYLGNATLQVYATAQNLWLLTNLIEGDPERTNIEQGTDTGYYPQTTTIKLGFKLSL